MNYSIPSLLLFILNYYNFSIALKILQLFKVRLYAFKNQIGWNGKKSLSPLKNPNIFRYQDIPLWYQDIPSNKSSIGIQKCLKDIWPQQMYQFQALGRLSRKRTLTFYWFNSINMTSVPIIIRHFPSDCLDVTIRYVL